MAPSTLAIAHRMFTFMDRGFNFKSKALSLPTKVAMQQFVCTPVFLT